MHAADRMCREPERFIHALAHVYIINRTFAGAPTEVPYL